MIETVLTLLSAVIPLLIKAFEKRLERTKGAEKNEIDEDIRVRIREALVSKGHRADIVSSVWDDHDRVLQDILHTAQSPDTGSARRS